jgi:hypothetical protein
MRLLLDASSNCENDTQHHILQAVIVEESCKSGSQWTLAYCIKLGCNSPWRSQPDSNGNPVFETEQFPNSYVRF